MAKTTERDQVLLRIVAGYGRDCADHMRGMFAFAIWDTRQQRLFIARDRLGIKPLYYRLTPDCFLFGSEIKVILTHPGVAPELNREVLAEYLAFGYPSGPDTFFLGIRKLMPGHTLALEGSGEIKIEQY